MVLVVVLWLIVLLSVIAAGHSRNVHITTTLASRQIELAKARALARAGARRAIMELLAAGNSHRWPVNGHVQTMEILDTEVMISIRDATGLLDLNNASPDLLAALMRISGAAPEAQQALVGAILDWRDTDDLTRLNGAENDAYQSAGLGWGIHNGPFATVDELRYVLGMSDAYFNRLAPLLTVHSGRGGVNIEFAPPLLIEALTGKQVEPVTGEAGTQLFPQRQTSAARAGTFHISVEARRAGGTAVASLEAVVRIAPTADQPYTIMLWREPMRSHFPGGG